MQKRGQFDISFSMIFSIIIIVAIIAVAFYVISGFLRTSRCAEIGLFYNDLKDYTDKAWQSTIHQDTFTGTIPSGIDMVCFGELSQAQQEFSDIKKAFLNSKGNVFLYPPKSACDSSLSSIKLENVQINSFFCKNVENSKIEIKTSKDKFDALVTIQE